MQDWNFYKCNVNDKIASVYLDMCLARSAPIDSLPFLHWFFVKLLTPSDEGLSTDEEFDSLVELEERLLASCDNSFQFAGRITTDGMRQFYFYSSDTTSDINRYQPVIDQFDQHPYQFGSKPDKDWSQYKNTLYPGKHGLQQIQDRED